MKPLGLLGLIDDNECDWKIIAINVEDPLASKLNGTLRPHMQSNVIKPHKRDGLQMLGYWHDGYVRSAHVGGEVFAVVVHSPRL